MLVEIHIFFSLWFDMNCSFIFRFLSLFRMVWLLLGDFFFFKILTYATMEISINSVMLIMWDFQLLCPLSLLFLVHK